jgi:hypothetical protein
MSYCSKRPREVERRMPEIVSSISGISPETLSEKVAGARDPQVTRAGSSSKCDGSASAQH